MTKNKQEEAVIESKFAEIPEHTDMDVSVFDQLPGDTFGGASDILALGVNQAAGPLTYIGQRMFDPGSGKMIPLHEAKDTSENVWRLPIAASFSRQMEAADIKRGDTFAFKRLDDAIKQRGVGKGNSMQMFVIKVLTRAAA